MYRSVNGNGNLHLRRDGLWQFDVMQNGKRRSFYGHTQEEALLKAGVAPQPTQSALPAKQNHSSMTLNEWFATWIDTFVQTKKSTKTKYKRDYRLYVSQQIGDMQLSAITAIHVQKLYIRMMNRNLSPKSVYNVHGVMSSMFKKALKLGYIEHNVVADCELPRLTKPEMHPLLDDTTSRFMEAAKGDRFYDEFFFAMFTGVRESELIGLTWNCINWNKHTIRIYRQLVKTGSLHRKGVFEFTSLKNGKERTIIIPQMIENLLRKLYAEYQKDKQARSYSNPQGFVFTNKDGSHIQYHTMYTHFKKIAKSIGRPETRFHDLRHTYATLAIQNGSDIKTVSSNLGHATVAFTMDRYGHVSDAMKKDSAERMNDLIKTTVELQ